MFLTQKLFTNFHSISSGKVNWEVVAEILSVQSRDLDPDLSDCIL